MDLTTVQYEKIVSPPYSNGHVILKSVSMSHFMKHGHNSSCDRNCIFLLKEPLDIWNESRKLLDNINARFSTFDTLLYTKLFIYFSSMVKQVPTT